MMKHKIVAVATAGVMIRTGTSGVLADAETNPTTNDAIGFCVSNHNRNHMDAGTIGSQRRENRGAQAEENQAILTEGTFLNWFCTSPQDPSAPGE